MTLRMKVVIGVALAAFAAVHVVAAVKVEAAGARQAPDAISLQRD
jgi:hypothetical protein